MSETPNGPFPDYRAERAETEREYLDRAFQCWLEWRNANTPTPAQVA